MRVQPIRSPLSGERVVAVEPRLAPEPTVDWRQRINAFVGRNLGARALEQEQRSRDGRTAMLAQVVSPGIVSGLEIELVQGEAGVLQLGAGSGLTAFGESVRVRRGVRVKLAEIAVFAPDPALFGTAAAPGTLHARDVRGPFATEVAAQAAAMPTAGVLVLQPVASKVVGRLGQDSCERNQGDDAFDDWRTEDGCRLLLYTWPVEAIALPPQNAQRRNALAYDVFAAEAALGVDALLPWEQLGVPIALIGFDDAFQAQFIDRNAVARAGGRPKRTLALVDAARSGTGFNGGHVHLWQARLLQFAEHLAELPPQANLLAQMRRLPPAGLLGKHAFNRVARSVAFFPASWSVRARPIALEEVDVHMRACASLAEFDLTELDSSGAGDEVDLLVPLPSVSYDPRLLESEVEDPVFAQSLDRLTTERGRWLTRRAQIRAKASAVMLALRGAAEPLDFPEPDPDALEEQETLAEAVESIDSNQPDRPVDPRFATDEADYDITLDEATAQFTSGPIARLTAKLGVRPADSASFLATEFADLAQLGLEPFIERLRARIDAADDQIDLGFARVHTDLYRNRLLLLGEADASRLATSPSLAIAARAASPAEYKDAIQTYVANAKTVRDVRQDPRIALKPVDLLKGKDLSGISLGAGIGGTFTLAQEVTRAPETSTPQNSGAAGDAGPATAPTLTPGSDARTGSQAVVFDSNAEFTSKGSSATTLFGSHVDKGAVLTGGGARPIGRTFGARLQSAQPLAFSISGLSQFKATTAFDSALREKAGAIPTTKVEPAMRSLGAAEQSPIVGAVTEFRTASIAERLRQSPSVEAKQYTVASKHDVYSGLSALALRVHDLAVPGLSLTGAAAATLGDMATKPAIRNDLLNSQFDKDPADGDESAFFAVGVRAMDHTIATLRIVEGRVQAFKRALEACTQAALELKTLAGKLRARLDVLARELGETRHDLSVARALRAEEQARVASINTRRARLFDEQVPFIVFTRRRRAVAPVRTPARTLDPGLGVDPVPAALARAVVLPEALRELIDLLRDAPVAWFPHIAPSLDRLDRIDVLHRAVLTAKVRATIPRTPASSANLLSGVAEVRAMARVLQTHSDTLARYRGAVAALDVADFVRESWRGVRERAESVLSLGDLIDGRHGRNDVAQRASLEIEHIENVVGCLYLEFHNVPPALRLDWSERFSQFDGAIDLRNLASLPRLAELEVVQRRTLQALVDWIYSRVANSEPRATALCSDLVRMALLVASHAPIDLIVAGHVEVATTVIPGGRITIQPLDINRVRVGMQVLVYKELDVVARGVVEDMAGGSVSARVLDAHGSGVALDERARVHFTDSPAQARAPSSSGAGRASGLIKLRR